MNDIKHIIVIGASAGGFKAITELVSKIPADLPAAIMVVLHLSKVSMVEVMQHHMQKHTSFRCSIAADGDAIREGNLYLAPTDRHMIVKAGVIRITRGPHENRWRPSIDVLFRSTAVAYSSSTIGIVLTGMLDDGTSGMSAIKRSGGICIVQEPGEAEFPDMPSNVLLNVDVDYRVHISDIGYVLQDIFSKPSRKQHVIPRDLQIEADITERMTSSIDEMEQIAKNSVFTCPECGGGLWKLNNDPAHRYRCHTGHTYNEKVLLETQAENTEASVWVSIRMMEERKSLLKTISKHEKHAGNLQASSSYNESADSIDVHIERLKNFLNSLHNDGDIMQDDLA
ncbi:chemotaxis protein CheB [Arcticibacter sp.]|uniref:chemotaxis protein CheB n=1 Tax=Arcticibacter sp. TaxID=1872630 RepID=UPI003890B6B7